MSLTGKVALITGSAQGIGKEIAVTLAADGADCLISDMNLDAARNTAKEIGTLGRRALAVQVNVADAENVAAMIQKGMEDFGRIHILVNNAGITRDGLLMRMKDEDWDQVLSVNLKGAFLCTRGVARIMMKQRSGRITQYRLHCGGHGECGSGQLRGIQGGPHRTDQDGVPGAGLTGGDRAVAPGFIDTAMTQVLSEDVRGKSFWPRFQWGGSARTGDVAQAVRFLASDEAAYITGQVIHVNGGMYM